MNDKFGEDKECIVQNEQTYFGDLASIFTYLMSRRK